MMRHNIPGFFQWQLSKYQHMDIVNDSVGLGIFDKLTGEILGHIGAGRHDDLAEPEIFYALKADAQGQGYATEAAKAVTQWVLQTFNIPYLIGTAAVDNIASQRVLEKCGYTYIDERTLFVHLLNQSHTFRYYRCYKPSLNYATITQRLIRNAQQAGDVETILLIGSRARVDQPADEFSDMDVIMVVDDPAPYLASSQWLNAIGNIWAMFVEDTLAGGKERRVLFEGALDVDFLIYSRRQFQQALSEAEFLSLFSRGCKVLHDRSGNAQSLPNPAPQREQAQPPSPDEFTNVVNDFWYHTVWTTKKIRRGELWVAKACADGYLKSHLLKVIEWHAHVTQGWDYDTWHAGRFIERWADPKVLQALSQVYAHYDADDLAQALLATMSLFHTLATEVATRLNYEYPTQADTQATTWVKQTLDDAPKK